MKMHHALKLIALVAMISSTVYAQSSNYCYTYSGSKMVLDEKPVKSGNQCPSGGGFIEAPNLQSARNQIDKSNHGNLIYDCAGIYRGCVKTLQNYGNKKPGFARQLCAEKQKVCLNPNDKRASAKLDNILKTLNPKVADMIKNLRDE